MAPPATPLPVPQLCKKLCTNTPCVAKKQEKKAFVKIGRGRYEKAGCRTKEAMSSIQLQLFASRSSFERIPSLKRVETPSAMTSTQ